MKILITGGSGYLGNRIALKFLDNGHEIVNVDLFNNLSKHEKLNFVKTDILDFEKLSKVFEDNKFDLIIHNAAKVPISKLKKSYFDINVVGTENILKLFDKFNINKLIYISSSAVYGIPEIVPVKENDIRKPLEKYGYSKKIAEDRCIEHMNKKNKNIIILRPRTILGEDRMGIFSILFFWVSLGLKVPVLNDGKNNYQFVDVRDFVDATYLAAFSNFTGSLNIGGDQFCSMREILEHLINKVDSKSLVKNVDKNYLVAIARFFSRLNIIPLKEYHFAAYGKDIYFDISLAKKQLSWSPKFSNKESIEHSYNLYIENKSSNLSFHTKKINNFFMKYGSYLI